MNRPPEVHVTDLHGPNPVSGRPPYTRWIVRDLRGTGGKLLFFLLCVSVGVAAVVGVGSLSSSLEAGIRDKARELIAADVRIDVRRSAGDLPEGLRDQLDGRAPGVRWVEVRETFSLASSMRDLVGGGPDLPIPGVSAGLRAVGRSQVIELKAVSPGYPLYGEAEVEPTNALARLTEPGRFAVVGPELLSRLGLEVGDPLLVAGRPFEIVGTVRSEPDRLGASLALGPRVLISTDALREAGLLTEVSRSEHSYLLALPDDADLAGTADWLRERLPRAEFEIETYREGRPELRRAIQQVSGFLGLVALLSLLVGGVGVAQTVRAWLATKWDQIAVLKSLGVRPREVLAMMVIEVALLALAGSAAGAAAGSVLQQTVPRLWADVIPMDLIQPLQPGPIALGMSMGVAVALGFSLPALLSVLRVPAARVLRRDSEPTRASRRTRILFGLLMLLVVFVVATVQARDLRVPATWIGGGFTLLLGVATLILAGAARLLILLVSRSRSERPGRVPWRYGTSALARPGAGTMAAVVALGLGILVVLNMVLVEGALTRQLREGLPRDAPSMFMLGIRDSQWPGLQELLRRSGADDAAVESVPVLMTRVEAVDGRSLDDLVREADEAEDRGLGWAARRQLRVTTLDELPDDNTVVEGRWFEDDDVWEASFEQEFAANLGVGLGSVLDVQVGDTRRSLRVTSLREVQWEGFGINFFVVVEPGSFDSKDTFRLATARLEREREQGVQDEIAAGFPGVTVIRVGEALEKVVEVVGQLSWGVRFLGLFTVIAGVVILGGAVAASAAQRGREAALLKALGMTRRQVALAFAVEYSLLGLVAALVAVLGALVTSWIAITYVLEAQWSFDPIPLLVALLAGVSLAVLAGVSASVGALRRRPIESLRA